MVYVGELWQFICREGRKQLGTESDHQVRRAVFGGDECLSIAFFVCINFVSTSLNMSCKLLTFFFPRTSATTLSASFSATDYDPVFGAKYDH